MEQTEYLTREVIECTKDLVDYVDQHKRQVNNTIQFRIAFNGKLKNFQQKTRELILGTDIKPETKIRTIVEVIPLISEALLKFPKEFQGSDLWLDLSIASNFSILTIASQGRQNDKWKLQASANILSKLLLKSPDIHIDPDFDYNDFPSVSRLRNALVMTSGVYLEAIVTIYDIGYDNLNEWAGKALYHFDLYWQMFDTLELHSIRQRFDLKGENLYARLRFFVMPLWNSLVFALNLFRIYGDNPPEEIKFYPSISPGRKGIIELSSKISDIFRSTVDHMYKLREDGIISKNDDPKDSEHIQRLDILSDFARLYHDQGLVYGKSTKDPDGINNLFQDAMAIFGKLEQLRDPKVDRFQSNLFAFYVDLYTVILEYHAIRPSDWTRSIINDIVNHKDQHIELYYKLIKIQISLDLRDGISQENRDQYLQDLRELEKRFEYRYREWIDVKILINHLQVLFNKEIKNTILNLFEDEIKVKDIRPDIKSNVLGYIENWKEEKELPSDLEIPNHVFDYHTWLGFKFNNTIPYYPFSMAYFVVNQKAN